MVLAAVAQICSRNNVANNLRTCRSVVQRAAQRGASIVCLPEASDYIAPSKDVIGLAEPLESSSFVRGLQEEARSNSVWVSVGVHELPADEGEREKKQCYNTQCLIDPQGRIANAYRKIHLFDVDIKDGMTVLESNTTLKGKDPPEITATDIGKVGMLTCYDLRFPEVSLILRQRGAEVITYPSAFVVKTGMAHWEALLRARAIETQCYVLAAAQIGAHPPTSRTSYGSACIVDPWGTILAQCNDNVSSYENQEEEGSGSFCMAEIDLDYLKRIRSEMPLWDQRRHDVYSQL